MRKLTRLLFLNLVIIFLTLSVMVISCSGARHRTRTHRSGGNVVADDDDAGENYRYPRSQFSADGGDDEYDPDEIINISTNNEVSCCALWKQKQQQ